MNKLVVNGRSTFQMADEEIKIGPGKSYEYEPEENKSVIVKNSIQVHLSDSPPFFITDLNNESQYS